MRAVRILDRSSHARLGLPLFLLALVALVAALTVVDPALAANGTVTGRVTEIGTGLPLVDVRAYFNGLDPENDSVAANALTTADGTYRLSLPAGGYRVMFVRDFMGWWEQYYDGHDSVDLADRVTVVAGQTTAGVNGQFAHIAVGWLRGTLRDAGTGAPLPNALVAIHTWDGQWHSPDYYVYADATGSFAKQLPAGTYRLGFSYSGYAERYYVDRLVFADADPVVVDDGGTTTVDGTLRVTPGWIEGVTRDFNGDIVAGVIVDVLDASTGALVATGMTDQDGAYSLGPITGAPGLKLVVRFTDPGLSFPVQYGGGVSDLAAATRYDAEPGYFRTVVSPRLYTGTAAIQGTLRDADGRPVAGVWVSARRKSDSSTIVAVKTGVDGRYLVAPLPVAGTTTYTLDFFSSDDGYFREYWRNATSSDTATPIELSAGTELTIDEVLETMCSIKGTVSDQRGALQGISVTLYDDQGEAVDLTQTSSMGEYAFEGLRVGAYRVGFTDPTGRHVAEYHADAADLDAATPVVLSAAAPDAIVPGTLLPTTISGTVRGVVVLQHILVTLYDDNGAVLRTTSTDGSGIYDFGPVAHGDYRIGFEDPDGEWKPEYYDDAASLGAATLVSLTAATPYAVADAQLTAHMSIRGSVGPDTDFAWLPPWPNDIEVTLYRLDGSVVDTIATGGGFQFGALVPGDYRLLFVDPSRQYVDEYYGDAPGCALAAATIHVGDANPHVYAEEQLQPSVGHPGAKPDGSAEVANEIIGPVNNGGLGSALDMAGDTLVVGAKWQWLGDSGHNPGVAYVYDRRGGTMIRTAALASPDPTDYGCFGSDVAIEGDRIAVAEFRDDGRGLDPGVVHVFERDGNGWELVATLRPGGSDRLLHRGFGASLSMSGDTIVVGAPYAKLNGDTEAGVVYVFTRSGGVWKQQARLTAASPSDDDFFGRSVAVHGDRLVVGADMDDTAAGVNAGSAFVFTRSGATWTRRAMLRPSDADIGIAFGGEVAISADTIMVAAVGQLYDQGAVYVYEPSGDTWRERARLTAGDGQPSDMFGRSLALDGGTAVVGSTAEGSDEASGQMTHGAAYRFTRIGGSWYQEARLAADKGALSRGVGSAVAVCGRVIAVSDTAFRKDPELAHSGAVRLFEPHRTAVDSPLVVAAEDGVLKNDQSPSSGPLQARLVDADGAVLGDHAATAHGAVDLSSDGAFSYVPAAGYTGVDGFFYQAYTSEWQSQATPVTVTVNDLTAPAITAADLARGWVNTPVTVTLSTGAATDVAAAEYRRRGPNLWNRYLQPFQVSRQGASTYDIRARDVYGNSATRTFSVRVDTKRPTPQAPTAATVTRGRTATLKYKIVDARPGSPSATVTIRVRNARNAEKWRVILKNKPVNKLLGYAFRCSLPRGTYRFLVTATDAAGNRETKPASNKLVVR